MLLIALGLLLQQKSAKRSRFRCDIGTFAMIIRVISVIRIEEFVLLVLFYRSRFKIHEVLDSRLNQPVDVLSTMFTKRRIIFCRWNTRAAKETATAKDE